MKNFQFLHNKLSAIISFLLLSTLQFSAQTSPGRISPPPVSGEDDSSFWLFYVALPILLVVVGVVAGWRLKAKKTVDGQISKDEKFDKSGWESEPVDADKEMEWFRKNHKVMGKKDKAYPKNLPKTSKVLMKKAIVQPVYEDITMDKQELKDKMQKLQFSQLPVNSFTELRPSKPFDHLPISSDSDLMSAVEQVQDELEEDEQVRELALRILAAFRTKNSVESLGQIALYDISSNLRSKAVTTLTEFDHESVFESLLLSCADTTREVRAAAARGVFRLSFDRADAWTRIIETNDEYRIRQAVRAALEADLVERSFDRLTHEDLRIAYEAFTVTALLIKSGETAKIFAALENHTDSNVKFALLHVLSIIKDERTLANLFDLLENPAVSEDVKDKADEAIRKFELIPA